MRARARKSWPLYQLWERAIFKQITIKREKSHRSHQFYRSIKIAAHPAKHRSNAFHIVYWLPRKIVPVWNIHTYGHLFTFSDALNNSVSICTRTTFNSHWVRRTVKPVIANFEQKHCMQWPGIIKMIITFCVHLHSVRSDFNGQCDFLGCQELKKKNRLS